MSTMAKAIIDLSNLPRDTLGWRGSLVEMLLREFSKVIIAGVPKS